MLRSVRGNPPRLVTTMNYATTEMHATSKLVGGAETQSLGRKSIESQKTNKSNYYSGFGSIIAFSLWPNRNLSSRVLILWPWFNNCNEVNTGTSTFVNSGEECILVFVTKRCRVVVQAASGVAHMIGIFLRHRRVSSSMGRASIDVASRVPCT